MKKERIIFHIDVNNAFLSWSAVKLLKEGCNIDIRKIPSVIGGDESKRHGIVLAKSPIAKKYGICTAETLYSARKKCKSLKVFPMEYEYYTEQSKQMFQYLSNFTSDIEVFSIDECFLELSGCTLLYDDLLKLAYYIKDTIYEKYGFTVNIGIGNNKLCAKMASDFEKPNKVHTLYKDEIIKKLWPLDVSDLFMVGKKTVDKLREYGINTIGDLANTDIDFLKKKYKSHGIMMWEYANGIDNSAVITERENAKSISVSQTLEVDVDDITRLRKILLEQSNSLGRTLRKNKQYTSLVGVIIKSNDFQSYIRQEKLKNSIDSDNEIFNIAFKIFQKFWDGNKIRSIGIRIGEFTNNCNEQISIFDVSKREVKKIDATIDKIKDKYGENVIIQASLVEKNK